MREEPDKWVNSILQGDCLEKLKEMEDNLVDAVVTDPPAGISFMGKEFDTFQNLQAFQNFICEVFTETLRVLKPGGHVLVWAIDRTSHHTAIGLERAGFEVRRKVYHLFGSGFPKSRNLWKNDFQKNIEKQLREQGVKDEIIWK